MFSFVLINSTLLDARNKLSSNGSGSFSEHDCINSNGNKAGANANILILLFMTFLLQDKDRAKKVACGMEHGVWGMEYWAVSSQQSAVSKKLSICDF
jgi:hypothetical protein